MGLPSKVEYPAMRAAYASSSFEATCGGPPWRTAGLWLGLRLRLRLAAAAALLRLLRRASRTSAELGHGTASPVAHAGGSPLGQRPASSSAIAPSQNVCTIGSGERIGSTISAPQMIAEHAHEARQQADAHAR